MNRAETRMISAALALQIAKTELAEAQREFDEAATALRVQGYHLNHKIMETSGDVPS